MKAITQFKAIAVAIYRKILVRYGKQSDSWAKTTAFSIGLMSSLTAI